MNWLFLAVVIFIFGMGVYGYVRGILRMLYSVVALIIAIAAMIIIAPIFSSLLKSNDTIMDAIETPIIETIGEKFDDGINVEGVLEDYYHLPKGISDKINDMISDDVDIAKDNITKSIANSIAEYICDLFAYIMIFFAVRIIILIVGKVFHLVEKLPVISTMNRLGGVTLAIVEALGCVWIFFIIMEVIHGSQLGQILINMVWENDFLRMLYQNNLFTFFLKKNI